MKACFTLAALSAALLVAAPAAAEPGPALTTVQGVTDGGRGDDGALWFTVWQRGVRFVADGEGAAEMFRTLREAASDGRSVTVTFDPASGRFDPATGEIGYRACGVAPVSGDAPGPRAACPASSEPPAGALADLAWGVAFAIGGDPGHALPRLDGALAATELDRRARITGLRLRASMRNELAGDLADQVAADRLRIGALADDRAWAALAPDDADAAMEAAVILTDLGDYRGAIEAYRRIIRRWPAQDYPALVRIGAIHRIERDYPGALAALDELVAREGPQRGMKYHYHRGWTLTLLGRLDEAVAELTAGIAEQPDYAPAFARRACANARLGRIGAAIIDQRAAIRLLDRLMTDNPSTWVREERAHAAEVTQALLVADREHSGQPTDVACLGGRDAQPRRDRSPQLPTG